MKLCNCPICGKLFVRTSRNICPECFQAEEEDFARVKAYLLENPRASLEEVHENTGVSRKQIIRFIRQGRLDTGNFTNVSVQCQMCGRPIKQGRLCSDCQKKVREDINSFTTKETTKGRVHLRSRIVEKRKH